MGRSADLEGSDLYLIEHVRETLAGHPALGELELEVAVTGNVIEVSGAVQTQERCGAITAVLAERFPDYEIRNRTTVLSPPEQPRVEELQ